MLFHFSRTYKVRNGALLAFCDALSSLDIDVKKSLLVINLAVFLRSYVGDSSTRD